MRTSRECATAAMLAGALTMAWLWTADASAAPQQLSCVLSDTGAQAGTANQPIVITFDQDAKTVTATAGAQNYSFSNASISSVSISGQGANVGVGIDRSSLGMVWQQYGADKVVTRYGQCRAAGPPASADTH